MKRARLSLSLVAATAAAGLLATVVPASSAALASAAASTPGPAFSRVSSAPVLPAHTASLGAVTGQTPLHLAVALKVRDQPGLTAFIAALSDQGSPSFHRYLTPAQFAARYGASAAQVAAVDQALRAEGLTPGPVDANRLSIPVSTTAAAADRAFAITVSRYRLPGGRVAYANAQAPRFAAAVAGDVQGVLGLSSVYLPQSLASRLTAQATAGHELRAVIPAATAASGPQPCTAARNAGPANFAYTANQFASHYGMTPLYGRGDLGQGVVVALAEFEPNSASDISAYKSCYKISTKVTYTKVDAGAGAGSGSGEAALDIEDVMGLAPDVSIDVYQAPNSGDTSTYDLYSQIIGNKSVKVVSTSWGLCELDSDSPLLDSEQTLFEDAATQGKTVLAASGDEGSTACFLDGSANGANLSVSDPASQPDVIGVGGTYINAGTESVWNESGVGAGAGGGGVSAGWCMPAYQDQTAIPGLINGDSVPDGSGCASGYFRQVPDVSADADPYSGYVYYFEGGWGGIGGTSAAAPLWAAVTALIDASPFCTTYGAGDAGVQAAPLYKTAAAEQAKIYPASGSPWALSDVTSGNNAYTPSGYGGGLYPATAGYDMATGLGTPLVTGLTPAGKASEFYPGLAALMCWAGRTKNKTTAITTISPAAGPVNTAQTVTLTGHGFMPVPGADHVLVGATTITASCSSTTKCTLKLPATAAGTVPVQMTVEDLTKSTVTSADHFRFVPAPKLTSVSPAHGSPGGGNRITIRGTNFIGVTAVYFGKRKGTKIKVTSATRLTVIVPAGSGTVTVKVYAAGGHSRIVAVSHYRY